MAKNSSLSKWGTVLAVLGGILNIVVAVLWLIGGLLEDIISIFTQISIGGQFLSGNVLIAAIIMIVASALVIFLAIGRFGLKELAVGILILVLGIVAGGYAAILIIIGGILFIIAGL